MTPSRPRWRNILRTLLILAAIAGNVALLLAVLWPK
jgi:hypothetical protein